MERTDSASLCRVRLTLESTEAVCHAPCLADYVSDELAQCYFVRLVFSVTLGLCLFINIMPRQGLNEGATGSVRKLIFFVMSVICVGIRGHGPEVMVSHLMDS